MTRAALAVVIAAVSAVACGGSAAAPQGLTAANVAVQQGDLPSGLVKCDLTGDISNFIKQEQSPDPQTAKSTATSWSDLQKNGAKSAYVALYTDSRASCSDLKNSKSNPAAATYPLVVNFVVQFKDEKSAVAGYKSDSSAFGFSASTLRSGGNAVQEGAATGLGPNSITLSRPVGNQAFFAAVWQNRAFMVILVILNIEPAASKKAATDENTRIK